MEKGKILQFLIPVAAIVAIGIVVAMIVGQSAPDTESTKVGTGATPSPPQSMKIIADVPANTEGTSLTKPPPDAPEWRDIGEGLKIWDVRVGEGEPVLVSDTGNWHYTGWLPTGDIFDSSVRKNEPFTSDLRSVIVGWTRGLPGMKAGGIRRLQIPSVLAYGQRGSGSIRPNTDLTFEVKLLRISR